MYRTLGMAPVALPGASRADSILGAALLLSLGRVVALAVTFAVPVIVARVLAPADFGTYRQFLLVFTTLYAVAQLGMAESLFYFVPAQPERAGLYAGNAMLVLLAAGIGSFVLLTALAGTLATALGNPALQGLGPLLGAYLALMLIAAPLEMLLVSRNRHAWASVGYGLSDIARAALLLLPLVLWHRLEALCAGLIVFAALRVAATLVYCRREFGAGFGADRAGLGSQLAYAWPLLLAMALQTAQANVHAYVVAGRFDPTTFAIYSVGCLQVPLVDLVASSACNVMMVRMREHAARGEPATMMHLWRQTARRVLLLVLPLLGALFVVSRDLLSVLFTEAYAGSVPVFRIWLAGLLLVALPAHGPLRVLGDTRFLALQTMVKLTIVVVFIDVFLSAFGLMGGALVSVAAVLVGKSMLLARLGHRTGVPLPQILPWRGFAGIVLAGAAAAVAAVAVGAVMRSGVERLLVTAVTYGSTYAVLTWCSGALEPAEKHALLRHGRRLASRYTGRRSCPAG